jgi:4-amino-4-deoxy-L-arabinose transferase-like glycosyltransferase
MVNNEQQEIANAPESKERLRWQKLVVLILVLAMYLAVGVFDHSLWSPTEPAVAGVVWNMYAHGELAIPRINEYPYFEKPPLCYWIPYFLCRTVGRLEDGLIRLPSAVYGLLCLALVYWVGRRRYGEEASLAMVLMAATGLAFYELAHRACSDMLATLFAFACLAIFIRSLPSDSDAVRRPFGFDLLFALVLAISFYAKNFYTYLIVLPPVFLFLAWRRQIRRLVVLGFLVGLFTAVWVLPWVIALYKSGGMDYVRVVFLNNTVGRFFDVGEMRSVDVTPLDDASIVEKDKDVLFYFYTLANLTLPWVFVYAVAVVLAFRRSAPKNDYLFFLRLALITIPAVLTFSASRVQEYLMPVLFILFLMSGYFFETSFSNGPSISKWMRRLLALNMILVGVFMLAVPIVLAVLLEWWVVALGSLLVAAGLYYLRKCGMGWPQWSLRFLGLVVLVWMISFAFLMPYLDQQKSYRYFFDDIREAVVGRTLYTTFCDDRRLPQMTYYLNQRVPVIPEKDLTAVATSGQRIGLILPLNLYARKSNDLARISHTVIETHRGKRSYVFVGIP